MHRLYRNKIKFIGNHPNKYIIYVILENLSSKHILSKEDYVDRKSEASKKRCT